MNTYTYSRERHQSSRANNPILALMLTLAQFLLFASTVNAAEQFPSEFIALGKQLGCRPLTNKAFYWGAVDNTKDKDSAAFWCQTKEDERSGDFFGSLAIYLRDEKSGLLSCPRLIPKQDVGRELEVWKPGHPGKPRQDLSHYVYLGTGKRGTKSPIVSGKIIENIYSRGSAGSYFYCNKGRWMKSSYE